MKTYKKATLLQNDCRKERQDYPTYFVYTINREIKKKFFVLKEFVLSIFVVFEFHRFQGQL